MKFEGTHRGAGLTVAIVTSRFNAPVVERLLAGALGQARQLGVSILEITVPGAFELPLGAKVVIETHQPDAVVALGCVIRGKTPHFDYICQQSAAGIATLSLATGIPIVFGVLTTETVEQAFDRAGLKLGNKGADSMVQAVEMITLIRQLKGSENG